MGEVLALLKGGGSNQPTNYPFDGENIFLLTKNEREDLKCSLVSLIGLAQMCLEIGPYNYLI